MPAGAIALALAAAFAHAVWNLLVAGARDPSAATAVAVWAGVLAFAPVALITGGVHTAALPYVAASGALHLVYMGLLAASYGRAELSLVYPLSRGSAPVLVLGAGAAFGTVPSAGQAVGVLMVVAGILLVRGFERPHDVRRPGLRRRRGGVHRGLHPRGQAGRVARLADRVPGAGAADRRTRLSPARPRSRAARPRSVPSCARAS
jgi:uncharacterized membrane protein